MSDVQDPLQDSLDRIFPTPAPPPDKKIVFGARKPTEGAVALIGVPLIIEAPFPYERTLQWVPSVPGEVKRIGADGILADEPTGEETMPAPDNRAGVEADDSIDNTHAAVASLMEIVGHTAVVVSQEVLLKVNEHVSQSLERELGGFLLGNRYRCPNTQRDYVIIDQYSPAKFTESTEVNLAFTHEAWAQLSDELSGKFLGKLLIGWYHSHPRMDVFLSGHDMEIHTERFPEPWMVAVVLEPERHLGGFFGARDGRVKPNSPVDFFELLERNSRDSVLAWINYSAVDPATSSAPVISPTNTASLTTTSQEILVARSQEDKKPRRRGRLLIALFFVALLLAAVTTGVAKRQQLKNWFQDKFAGTAQPSGPATEPQGPAVQPQGATTGQPQEAATQPPETATPPAVDPTSPSAAATQAVAAPTQPEVTATSTEGAGTPPQSGATLPPAAASRRALAARRAAAAAAARARRKSGSKPKPRRR